MAWGHVQLGVNITVATNLEFHANSELCPCRILKRRTPQRLLKRVPLFASGAFYMDPTREDLFEFYVAVLF